MGLAYFLHVGSPASKENDDRLEAKIDELIRLADPAKADALIEKIDRDYLRAADHAKPHGHDDVGAGKRSRRIHRDRASDRRRDRSNTCGARGGHCGQAGKNGTTGKTIEELLRRF